MRPQKYALDLLETAEMKWYDVREQLYDLWGNVLEAVEHLEKEGISVKQLYEWDNAKHYYWAVRSSLEDFAVHLSFFSKKVCSGLDVRV
jgi:site-specific DNA-adenine methylase